MWYNSLIACQLTTITRFLGVKLGFVVTWAWIAKRAWVMSQLGLVGKG